MAIYSDSDRQELVNGLISSALQSKCRTRYVGTTVETMRDMGTWLQNHHPAQPIGVIFDARTAHIATEHLFPVLRATRLQVDAVCVEDPSPGHSPICSSALGADVARRFAQKPELIVSVGGGTMTDTGKLAANALGVPCAAFGTAASMNGFTSGLAATLDQGVKLTRKIPAPVAVWGHPNVLADAPAALQSAGLGDLCSKPISSADWRLSHLLNDAPWDLDVIHFLDRIHPLSTGLSRGIVERNPHALAQLFAALCLTGVAMQFASPGAQASGAEHLISHYLDMIAGSGEFGHQATHHGAQVAVGCMVSLSAWAYTRAAFREGRAFGTCPKPVYDTVARQEWIDHHFRSIAPAIVRMHDASPCAQEDVQRRREILSTKGNDILSDATRHLPSLDALRDVLHTANCPVTFEAIGVSDSLAHDCVRYAPWVRARYTILHLLLECGWYDDFIASLFASHHV